ncbi:MAG: DUF4344 domain-containing metallopeptidase [Acidobacteriota bacterium]|nr:DUF4344 domain-containing metallopeptidase [Acidobacteriota bacterium]MDH3529702.1 DUF4344 domain-containing metallopeptidase [Acidobacteriota bacterium]
MPPFNRNLFNLVAVLAVLGFLLACGCPSIRDGGERSRGKETVDKPEQGEEKPENPEPADTKAAREKDEGDFVVEHQTVTNVRYRDIDRSFRENKVLEKAADKLNRSLILPHDITLRTKDCGEINAFYNPNERSITFCYELMEYFFHLFKSDGDNDARARERMNKAMTFVFLHEVGHALIDGYELPITGNEEDAADRCSAFICIEELGDDGVEAIVAAAEGFAIESRMSRPDKRNMADEHLLQEQRFFNSLCMIYGSDPGKYADFKKNNLLPASRAVRCPSEYERMAKSWENLLKPWRKD